MFRGNLRVNGIIFTCLHHTIPATQTICQMSPMECSKFSFSWCQVRWVILTCLLYVLAYVNCIRNKVGWVDSVQVPSFQFCYGSRKGKSLA